jgi:hypothetical protein
MDVFATAFLPGTLYFKKWLQSNDPVIDLGENFIKQTYRSRCTILSSNGPLMITIPLRKNDSKRVGDIEISYAEDWQTKGLRAIRSSYANSPYYEHYQEEFEALFMSKNELLYSYNRELFNWLLKNLYIEKNPGYSTEFISVGFNNDFRSKEFGSSLEMKEYKQVFSHKVNFIPGLSVIDLLFNKGPESLPFLQ